MGKRGPKPRAINAAQRRCLLRLLRRGYFVAHACRACVVEPTTYLRWLALGGYPGSKSRLAVPRDRAEEPYRSFAAAVEQAEAEAEGAALAALFGAMETEWWAALWFLARRFPDRWGERNRSRQTSAAAPGRVEVVPAGQAAWPADALPKLDKE